MRLKRTLVTLAITVLTMGLLPMGSAIAGVSGVSVDTVGTPMWVKPISNDVQMMNIKIASDSTGGTLVKLTVTYTGTDPADVSVVKLYDGGTMLQAQSMTSGVATFNVTKLLTPSITTTLKLKADINNVADGREVKFRLDPGSVVLQTGSPAVTAFTNPAYGVIVDGTPPNPPSDIAFPTVNDASKASAPISGTAEANAWVTVVITDAPGPHSTTTQVEADGMGAWSATPDLSLFLDGSLTTSVYANDGAGNASSAVAGSGSKDVIFPNVSASGPAYWNKSHDASPGSFTISGTAEQNAKMNLTIPGFLSTTTVADPFFGIYSFSPNLTDMPDGPFVATVTATDAALNTTTLVMPSKIKDTILEPLSVSVGDGYVNASNVTAWHVSGTAAPDAVVDILVDDATAGGAVPKSTTADPTGHYSFSTLNLSDLADGNLSVVVTQTDAAGNTQTKTQPAIANVTKDVSVPLDSSIDSSPAVVNNTDKTAVVITGTLNNAADSVKIVITDAGSLHTVSYDAIYTGAAWTATVSVSALNDGTITFTVKEWDFAGNSSPGVKVTATKDTGIPAVPSVVAFPPVYSGNASSVGISGIAEAGTTVDVTVTSATGGMPVSATMIAAGGSYSFSLNLSGLNDGQLTAKVTATDAALNKSAERLTTVAKDTVASAPDIWGMEFPTVNSVNQASFPFSGDVHNVEPGATVKVRVKDTTTHDQTFTALAGSDGAWTLNANLTNWDEGPLLVAFSQVDLAGNTSFTASTIITKETVLPTIGSAEVAYGGLNTSYAYYASNRPADITATASESVTWTYKVKDPYGTTLVPNTTVSSASFALTWAPAKFAATGNYTVTLSATDLAGNPVAAPTTITIPVYNYDFRVVSTRILNSDKTTEALFVTAGNDYYAEVTVENLNVAATAPEVVFQQSQGTVQAFDSAQTSVLGETTGKFSFLWHPTVGSKSVDFFVWNHLAPAGREALSTQSHTTVTVN